MLGRLTNLLSPYGLITAVSALLAIMVHESCHALAAYALGDSTARDMGRISFNPLKHVDLLGLLMLVTVGFGWAKPVMIDSRNFKNQKRGMALSAAAGPLSNFVFAFLCVIIFALLSTRAGDGVAAYWIRTFLYYCIIINIGLGVFNLFPVPPLDGSKIIGVFLPDRYYYPLLRYERYGMMVLVLLLFTGILDAPLSAMRTGVLDAMLRAAGFLTGW